ncbi:apolipoprotein N-acyltransferase [Sphingomonas aracearum]|uniref:Apolipoprotein N-acyltransferase n=1 Tax=Sphingomonas aracearum TaxID=2283317 RepID=A0A369VX12_9SPHN|nr:apolipoprotein N-acyltransferase [Sphingomonas aracearum]RDE06926.1 apolipoprotein N-acyltransferase [Sphingomonas aracearum]
MARFLDGRWAWLAPLALGAASATGFAPLDLWPVTVGCFCAWLLLVYRAPGLGKALLTGWLFGVGHFTIGNNWIQHAFDFQQSMPPALGYLAVVALALYLAIYPMLAAGLAWRFGRSAARPDAAFAAVFGAGWIATEWLRATMFTGYAWNPLAVIWVPLPPLSSLAAWIGTYALSGLTVLLAGLLLAASGNRRRMLASAGALAVGFAALLLTRPAVPPSPAGAPLLRVVQPNIGQNERSEFDGEVMHARLAALSGRPDAVPRLVLWPEGVIREYLEDGYPYWYYEGLTPRYARRRLSRLLGPRDVLLAGSTALQFTRDDEIESATNSVFAVGADARLHGRYDKAHLVPYGEYLPMRPILSAIGLSRLVPGDIDFADGPGPRAIAVPGFGSVGVQICYEIIFSGQVVDEAHRPRLLFNPSNDAWFGSWGPPEHLAQARLRAIEEGLPIVRATPTGISAVIAANGALLGALPLNRAGALQMPMPQPLPPTLFARAGQWMSVAAVLALAALAVALRRRRL